MQKKGLKVRMDKDFRTEVKLSFFKRITGRQDPSLKRIIASIFIALLFFLGTFFAGFYLNRLMIKPEANVVFHPFIEEGKYLPIEIENGPKSLHNINLKIKTCYMDTYKEYTIPNLIAGQDYPVHLTDEDTVFALDKVFKSEEFICNPKNVSASVQCYIQPYVVKGKLYVPEQECKKYRCGYCPYEMIFSSDEFSDNFSSLFPGPVEVSTYKLMITPNNPVQVGEEYMEPFSPVGISLFSPYDLCMLESNQNFEYCGRLPMEVIFDKPLTLSISPVNKSLGNVSINLTQIT